LLLGFRSVCMDTADWSIVMIVMIIWFMTDFPALHTWSMKA
jgi:hypothetical protein